MYIHYVRAGCHSHSPPSPYRGAAQRDCRAPAHPPHAAPRPGVSGTTGARGTAQGCPAPLQKWCSPLAATAWPMGSMPMRPGAGAGAGDSEACGWAAPPWLLLTAAPQPGGGLAIPKPAGQRPKHHPSPRGLPATFLRKGKHESRQAHAEGSQTCFPLKQELERGSWRPLCLPPCGSGKIPPQWVCSKIRTA